MIALVLVALIQLNLAHGLQPLGAQAVPYALGASSRSTILALTRSTARGVGGLFGHGWEALKVVQRRLTGLEWGL